LWNINVTNQAIRDTLQGSVATYLRCGGSVNNQSKKGLLRTAESASEIFKIGELWQSYQQEGGCLVHFVRMATAMLKVEESA